MGRRPVSALDEAEVMWEPMNQADFIHICKKANAVSSTRVGFLATHPLTPGHRQRDQLLPPRCPSLTLHQRLQGQSKGGWKPR